MVNPLGGAISLRIEEGLRLFCDFAQSLN